MKPIPELRKILVERYNPTTLPAEMQIGTWRVDIKNVEHVRHEARVRDWTFTVDEPPERGGTNMGLNPLGYFVLGAVSCFMSQLSKAAIVKDLKIDTMEITARAHTDMVRRVFTDAIYDIRLTGEESVENATMLMHEAEERCFVHQTLKKAMKITDNLYMNGTLAATNTLGAAAQVSST